MDNHIQPTIRRYRIADQAYDILKSWILNGLLTPGEEIAVDELAKKLNVSRTPIREALNKLKGKGLILDTKEGRTSVVKLSSEELAQIFELRAALEVLALKWGLENISRERLQENLRMLQKAKKDLEKGSSESFCKSDSILHDTIVTSANNKWLTQLLSQLQNLIGVTKSMCVSVDRYKASIPEHILIVESILEGDKDAAVQELEIHLNNAKQRLLNSLEQKETGK